MSHFQSHTETFIPKRRYNEIHHIQLRTVGDLHHSERTVRFTDDVQVDIDGCARAA
jgi:DNA-binding MltR family transcriptional regulator